MLVTCGDHILQIKIDGDKDVAGDKAAGFKMAKAYKMVDSIWTEKAFNRAETREDFVAKLDQAIGDMGGSVRL